MDNILKLNYDDFYKFLISAGLLTLIVSSIIASYFLNEAIEIDNDSGGILYDFYFALFVFYFVFSILGVFAIVFGLKKWYINQKKLDEKLGLELEIQKTENKHRKLELKIKKLELKKLHLEHERIENELNLENRIISRNYEFSKKIDIIPEKYRGRFI